MPISLKRAAELCTAGELRLVAASRRGALEKLDLPRAKQKLALARKLRDKWTDLAQKQRRAARGKTPGRAARPAAGGLRSALDGQRSALAGQRTALKAELFGETLARFEARVLKLEDAERKAAAPAERPADRTRTGAKHKGGARPAEAMPPHALVAARSRDRLRKLRAERTKAGRVERQVRRSGSTRVNAHVAARGRRRQAKRDSR